MTETSPAAEVEEISGYETPPGPRTGWLVAGCVAWLAAILWVTHASIAVSGADIGLVNAAIALPNVVSACLLAGGAIGLTAASGFARRSMATRIGAGAVAGLVTGGLAGAYTFLTWGVGGPVTALAVMFGVAGVLGGALAAALPRTVATAGLVATLAVFVIGLGASLLKDRVVGSSADLRSANGYFLAAVALISAVAAGLLAFWRLRRATAPAADLTWPFYLTAGAVPGVMLLLAEVVTRVGGARMVDLAVAGSEIDAYRFSAAAGSRLNHALVVLFLGAIAALVAFGRTLPRRRVTP